MKRILLILWVIIFSLPTTVSAQLSNEIVEELATKHVDKWSLILGLSKSRESQFKNIWIKHEKKRSLILRKTTNIREELQEAERAFISDLSKILTPNELEVYEEVEHFRLQDDREYLKSLLGVISSDTLFVEAYGDLQYKEILPSIISFRLELEQHITTADKASLDSLRVNILNMYDKCLITCLANDHSEHHRFEKFDELMIVEINKDLNNNNSELQKLVALTRKYEEEIHNIFIKHQQKFSYWSKRKKELEAEYILPAYNRSIAELKKRNGLNTLKHIETDVIFLLIDPYDNNASSKFLNIGMHNQF